MPNLESQTVQADGLIPDATRYFAFCDSLDLNPNVFGILAGGYQRLHGEMSSRADSKRILKLRKPPTRFPFSLPKAMAAFNQDDGHIRRIAENGRDRILASQPDDRVIKRGGNQFAGRRMVQGETLGTNQFREDAAHYPVVLGSGGLWMENLRGKPRSMFGNRRSQTQFVYAETHFGGIRHVGP